MADKHIWNFFRAGGFDQVQINSGADMLALKELNQKLWVALSCPTRGVEFDSRTLDLIDGDNDAHVRVNEVLAAIAWAGALLKSADLLIEGSDRLALSDINDDSAEGKQVRVAAQHILKSLGKADVGEISLADMSDSEKLLAAQIFNGDGVVGAEQTEDAELRAVIADIAKCGGTLTGKGGDDGISQEISDKFFAEADAYVQWHAKSTNDAAILFLGEQTHTAAEALHAVFDKVNDYFTRCQLAAYDTRAALPLSRAVEDYQQIASQSLSAQSAELANFPLATVAADKPLSLAAGINPAWQTKMDALRTQVIVPLSGAKDSLAAGEWAELCARFAPFDAWLAAKPATPVEQLGVARLLDLLDGGWKAAVDGLIAQDKAVEEEIKAINELEKLLRYKRDLFALVNNFVSFRNFYTGKDKAIFQIGTLYLDGRSCELCVKVDDVAKHAAFAASSGVCLVYCDCVRNGGKEKMSIAAAFTAGDSDYLMVGRNGVFYDRSGVDWDAGIVRIIDHPISLRQAFWMPYKKLAKMISENLQKFAASKASAAEGNMLKAVDAGGKSVSAGPSEPPKPFDVGKFAGIFAAIGLAIGAIGGILASIVSGLVSLALWQMPLALAGLMLLISGPSVALAWFKLKKRSLAPILDANGWAINARARINIPFGTSLTSLANLPEGANRSLFDPYADKKSVWPYYALGLLTIAALVALWYFGIFGSR
ncbi:MAG: hypothetical protein PHH47_01590 [Gallionella sp.]|nr:hypothetical protein [Gallionella sp.]MDD4946738.1 hypothetical protein [Gallionella sp.]MDD5612002.1 hypothetical protein [Gallionella sp.]